MQEMTYCISNEDNTNNSLRKNYFQCVHVNGRNFFQKKNFFVIAISLLCGLYIWISAQV